MTGPIMRIGATAAIGYAEQLKTGVPTLVTADITAATPPAATAGQWVEPLANTLKYSPGMHWIRTGTGNASSAQRVARGPSGVSGSFTIPLNGHAGANLLAFALGRGSDTQSTTGLVTGIHKHLMIPKISPRYLTVEDQWVGEQGHGDGQSYLYYDCLADKVTIAYGTDGWTVAYDMLGGQGDTPLTPPTVPTFYADSTGGSLSPVVGLTSDLQWGHIVTTGTGVVAQLPGGIPLTSLQDWSLVIARNVKQIRGASFYPTKVGFGDFAVSGQFTALFDSAGAATAYARYCSGVEDSTTDIALTLQTGDWSTGGDATAQGYIFSTSPDGGTTLSHNVHIIGDMVKQWRVQDFTMVQVPWELRAPYTCFSIAAYNTDAAAY